ncbi:MAG: universal stress protein [Deltaproteobacteria bacterium]|nr:universal stress protein [Candidatus Anaeroferrophillus wilburensis]MBN2888730.1 universal stress protein [Deltaproteobacteria bacterium]
MTLRILVPVDDTLASFRTQQYLIRMKESLRPTVTLLTVISMSNLAYRCIPDFQQEMIRDNALKMGKLTLERHAEEYAAAGILFDTILEKGDDPGAVICAVARRQGVEMICLSPSNSSEMSDLVFGSVANYVTHHAPCPVLLVR